VPLFYPRLLLPGRRPNFLFKTFFDHRGEFADVEWDGLGEMDADPVFEAWQALPEASRNDVERWFKQHGEFPRESWQTIGVGHKRAPLFIILGLSDISGVQPFARPGLPPGLGVVPDQRRCWPAEGREAQNT